MVCIQNIKNFMLGWEVSQIFNFGLGFFNFSVQWYKFFMGSDVGKGIKCARCDKEDIDKWQSQTAQEKHIDTCGWLGRFS